MTAINPHVRASHEARRIAAQEHSGALIVLSITQPAKHVLCRPIGSSLWELDEELLDHAGDDIARRDGVNADAVHAPFGRKVATQLQHAGFRGVVGCAEQVLLRNVLVGLGEWARAK